MKGKANLGGFVLPLIIYFYLWIYFDQNRIYSFTSTMFVGAIYFAVKNVLHMEPVFIIYDESLQISLFLTMIILFMAQNLLEAIQLYLGGTIAFELFFLYSNERHLVKEFILGEQMVRDILVFGLIEVWMTWMLFEHIKQWFKQRKIHIWRNKQINGE
ncbi:hypothetical protein ACMW72_05250 [Tepidibacillus sp. LV47]